MPACCRVCLKHIFSNDIFLSSISYDGNTIPCHKAMMLLFSFPITPNDGLPTKLCKTCFTNISSAYKLKILAEKSYLVLIDTILKNEDKNNMNITSNILSDIKENYDDYLSIKNESNSVTNVINTDITEKLLNEKSETVCKLYSGCEYDFKREVSIQCPISALKDDESLLFIKSLNKNTQKKETIISDRKTNNVKDKYLILENKLKICDLCGKQVTHLKEHIKLHDANRKRFPCTCCSRTFATLGALKKHMSSQHLGLLYYCDICKKNYKHGNEHNRLMHSSTSKSFICSMCNKKFITKGLLKFHMTGHTKIKAFSCSECAKSFRSKELCNCHKRRVHDQEKKFICHYCSKAFFSHNNLDVHLRIHTKEKKYICKDCDKRFTTCSALKIHEKRHLGIKEVHCEFCDKAFVNKGALSSHMISHTKEKKFECKYCGLKFGRSDHRVRHEKTAHEKLLEVQCLGREKIKGGFNR